MGAYRYCKEGHGLNAPTLEEYRAGEHVCTCGEVVETFSTEEKVNAVLDFLIQQEDMAKAMLEQMRSNRS